MKNEKMMNRVFYLALIGLLASATFAGFTPRIDAHMDLKEMLVGETGKRWEQKDIELDPEEHNKEETAEGEAVETGYRLATIVPGIIDLKADGTCEMTYFSHYKDGKMVKEHYKAKGKWTIEGKSLKIIEDVTEDGKIDEKSDQTIWLKDIVVTENKFKSKFSLQDSYTGGVKELAYATEAEDAD